MFRIISIAAIEMFSHHFCCSCLKAKVKGDGTLNKYYIYQFWKCADPIYTKLSKLVYACRNYSLPDLARLIVAQRQSASTLCIVMRIRRFVSLCFVVYLLTYGMAYILYTVLFQQIPLGGKWDSRWRVVQPRKLTRKSSSSLQLSRSTDLRLDADDPNFTRDQREDSSTRKVQYDAIQCIISLFGSVFCWVLKSDWDQRSAKKWSRFRWAIRWDQTLDWANAESKAN